MQVEYEYENGGRHGNVKGYNVSDLKNVHVSHSFQSPTAAKQLEYTRPSLSHYQPGRDANLCRSRGNRYVTNLLKQFIRDKQYQSRVTRPGPSLFLVRESY